LKKMWRMDILIHHKCGERQITFGHHCFKARFFNSSPRRVGRGMVINSFFTQIWNKCLTAHFSVQRAKLLLVLNFFFLNIL
jgi:hypothetical protein